MPSDLWRNRVTEFESQFTDFYGRITARRISRRIVLSVNPPQNAPAAAEFPIFLSPITSMILSPVLISVVSHNHHHHITLH